MSERGMGVDSLPTRVLAHLRFHRATFAELVSAFGMRSPRERKDLFDALASLLARGLVNRTGSRGTYLYATERPALPAIELAPVPLLHVSLGVVLDRAA